MPTFLDAEAFIDHLDMTMNLWKCANVDTLAAIAGPMAYAYYKKMPDALVYQAQKKLPEWMVDVSERFDELMNNCITPCLAPCYLIVIMLSTYFILLFQFFRLFSRSSSIFKSSASAC